MVALCVSILRNHRHRHPVTSAWSFHIVIHRRTPRQSTIFRYFLYRVHGEAATAFSGGHMSYNIQTRQRPATLLIDAK